MKDVSTIGLDLAKQVFQALIPFGLSAGVGLVIASTLLFLH